MGLGWWGPGSRLGFEVEDRPLLFWRGEGGGSLVFYSGGGKDDVMFYLPCGDWRGDKGRGRGRGRTYLLLALLFRPLTTHPFQDGAPFPFLIETPPNVRVLSTFGTITVHQNTGWRLPVVDQC